MKGLGVFVCLCKYVCIMLSVQYKKDNYLVKRLMCTILSFFLVLSAMAVERHAWFDLVSVLLCSSIVRPAWDEIEDRPVCGNSPVCLLKAL